MGRKRKANQMLKAMSPEPNGTYICTQCSKLFLRGCGLASHMRRHKSVLFKCEECHYTCKHKTAFNRHLLQMHGVGTSGGGEEKVKKEDGDNSSQESDDSDESESSEEEPSEDEMPVLERQPGEFDQMPKLVKEEDVPQPATDRKPAPYDCPLCHHRFEHKSRAAFHIQCHRQKKWLAPKTKAMFRKSGVEKNVGFMLGAHAVIRWRLNRECRPISQRRAQLYKFMSENFGEIVPKETKPVAPAAPAPKHPVYSGRTRAATSAAIQQVKIHLAKAQRKNKLLRMKSKVAFAQKLFVNENHYYLCRQCPYTTWNMTSAWLHFRHHIQASKESFNCCACSYSSIHRRSIEQHTKMHTRAENDVEFQCWLRHERHVNKSDFSREFNVSPCKAPILSPIESVAQKSDSSPRKTRSARLREEYGPPAPKLARMSPAPRLNRYSPAPQLIKMAPTSKLAAIASAPKVAPPPKPLRITPASNPLDMTPAPKLRPVSPMTSVPETSSPAPTLVPMDDFVYETPTKAPPKASETISPPVRNLRNHLPVTRSQTAEKSASGSTTPKSRLGSVAPTTKTPETVSKPVTPKHPEVMKLQSPKTTEAAAPNTSLKPTTSESKEVAKPEAVKQKQLVNPDVTPKKLPKAVPEPKDTASKPVTPQPKDAVKSVVDKPKDSSKRNSSTDSKEVAKPKIQKEAEKIVAPMKTATPEKVKEAAKPKVPEKPVESVEPIQEAVKKSSKAVEPKKVAKPTEVASPKEVIKPKEAAKPSEHVERKEVVKPTEVVKPKEVVEPKEIAKSKDVDKPKEAGKPKPAAKPNETAKSKEAVKPKEVTKPTEAAKSKEVVKPKETEKPKETVKASEVAKPKEVVKAKDTVKPKEFAKPREVCKPAELPKPPATTRSVFVKPDESQPSTSTKFSIFARPSTRSSVAPKPAEIPPPEPAAKPAAKAKPAPPPPPPPRVSTRPTRAAASVYKTVQNPVKEPEPEEPKYPLDFIDTIEFLPDTRPPRTREELYELSKYAPVFGGPFLQPRFRLMILGRLDRGPQKRPHESVAKPATQTAGPSNAQPKVQPKAQLKIQPKDLLIARQKARIAARAAARTTARPAEPVAKPAPTPVTHGDDIQSTSTAKPRRGRGRPCKKQYPNFLKRKYILAREAAAREAQQAALPKPTPQPAPQSAPQPASKAAPKLAPKLAPKAVPKVAPKAAPKPDPNAPKRPIFEDFEKRYPANPWGIAKYPTEAMLKFQEAMAEYNRQVARSKLEKVGTKVPFKKLTPEAQAQYGRCNAREYMMREMRIERSGQCADCPYHEYKDLSKFRLHRDRHYYPAPHKCKECSYSAHDKAEVNLHMYVDHYIAEVKAVEGISSEEEPDSEEEEIPLPPPEKKKRGRKGKRRGNNW